MPYSYLKTKLHPILLFIQTYFRIQSDVFDSIKNLLNYRKVLQYNYHIRRDCVLTTNKNTKQRKKNKIKSKNILVKFVVVILIN